jgi:3-methyl-2-oxobutanoate hydroxymethyltransferase
MGSVIRAIIDAGIPVMGHLGLTPQSLHQFGGYRVQGRDAVSAEQLFDEAAFLEHVGCFSLVLEGIPGELARRITESVAIPTIGIGAGADCDGQVLVVNDLLGVLDEFKPKFVKRYAEIGREMTRAFATYVEDVKKGAFPDAGHSYS